jgi:hypothetical protein
LTVARLAAAAAAIAHPVALLVFDVLALSGIDREQASENTCQSSVHGPNSVRLVYRQRMPRAG